MRECYQPFGWHIIAILQRALVPSNRMALSSMLFMMEQPNGRHPTASFYSSRCVLHCQQQQQQQA